MAITYAYPTAIPELQDLLVGTEMTVQGGEDAPRTRTFTIGSIIDLAETILPSQVNSDWNATSGFAEILNKPIIPATPGLQQVIDVDTYAEVDGGNSYVDILGDTFGNKYFDFTSANGIYGVGQLSSQIYTDNTTSYLINTLNNDTSRIKATDGNVELHRQANEIGKTTVATFNRPTQDTILKFPAKSAAGTYTLATLDDIPATALVFLDEGNGNGIVKSDRNPALFGNIGEYAFDISWSDTAGNYGATGESSFAVGDLLTAQGYGSFLIGQGNVSSDESNYTFQSGYNHSETGSCFANFFTGAGHSITGGAYATIVGQFANVIANNPNNVNDGNNTMFAIGNGTADGGGNMSSRSTALQVYRDGRVVAPALTTALITADTTNKILVSKEYTNTTYKKILIRSSAPQSGGGSTSPMLMSKSLIPANSFALGDFIQLRAVFSKSNTNASGTAYISINTVDSLVGATQIAAYAFTSGLVTATLTREWLVESGAIRGYYTNSSSIDGVGPIETTFLPSTAAFSISTPIWFLISVQFDSASDGYTYRGINITN